MGASRALVFIGCGLFAGIMLFLHVVRRDLSPLNRGMSRYAGSPTLALATLAFLALAGAVEALAASLDPQGRRLALVAAAGLVGVAATPIGQLRQFCGRTALDAIGGSCLLRGHHRRDVRLSRTGRWADSPMEPGRSTDLVLRRRVRGARTAARGRLAATRSICFDRRVATTPGAQLEETVAVGRWLRIAPMDALRREG